MGKYNLSHYDCKESIGATTVGYCDIQDPGCDAIDEPNVVSQYYLRKKKAGKVIDSQLICVCQNCKSALSVLPDC